MSAGLAPASLRQQGLLLGALHGVHGELRFERPAWVHAHRLKDCTLGAFAYLNAAGSISLYRTHCGRYAQIGEGSIIGPPEHPHEGFSNHPFAFTRPRYMPGMYSLPDFARLAPEELPGPSYVDTVPSETWIGHEAYVGAGSFVRRGLRIGDGAIVGARSVVTRDVPAYAIAVGSPARVIRLRFSENLVERLIALQWWRYDLAPFKTQVDFTQLEPTLEFFEQAKAEGRLAPLRPDTYRVRAQTGGLAVERLAAPLYFPDD